MDEEAFRIFLKRGGRSPSAVKRAVLQVEEYERYLRENRGGRRPDNAGREDLEAFASWIEGRRPGASKLYLWAIRYYYQFTSNDGMRRKAAELRQAKIERAPFPLKEFRGVSIEHLKKLEARGIRNVKQMLEAGTTRAARKKLSLDTGIPENAILELAKLSDLARIQGIKGIRARLYYDAGVDTIEKMAKWDPEKLRAMLINFVEKTGFEGIAPLPKEAKFSVETARKLSKIIEY